LLQRLARTTENILSKVAGLTKNSQRSKTLKII